MPAPILAATHLLMVHKDLKTYLGLAAILAHGIVASPLLRMTRQRALASRPEPKSCQRITRFTMLGTLSYN